MNIQCILWLVIAICMMLIAYVLGVLSIIVVQHIKEYTQHGLTTLIALDCSICTMSFQISRPAYTHLVVAIYCLS